MTAKKKPAPKKVAKKEEAGVVDIKIPRSNKTPQTVRGFRDILPVDQVYWDYIRKVAPEIANAYSYDYIDLPILEEASLFVRSVGEETEVVNKEMFVFMDKGGDVVSLRPEATASIARAYINHGMLNLPQPVKLWYMGPMFRYERPQSGRYRQFYQFGCEVLGEKSPVLDAQLMIMAYSFCKDLGIDVVLQVNSLGTPADRKEYVKKLTSYLKSQMKYLDEQAQETFARNPLRLLDSKDEKVQAVLEDAPQILDHLSDESRKHLMSVLEYLDELSIPYELNSKLVRGLDYYTQTVFEIWGANDDRKGQLALGGGGRYDNLIKELGGRETPAAGFALGLERIVLKLKEKEQPLPPLFKPQVLVAQLGDAPRRKAMALFEELRKEGINVIEAFSKSNLKQQLDIANKRGVRYTLILGAAELHDGVVLARDMEGGMQETIPFKKVAKEIKKRFTEEYLLAHPKKK
ncbi:histidine--tRNA ligase [Candidatus Falkowbacteria bacterium]|nr:histidine--tRNA ligase [Candidatus Falkowbacteria bacterium]